MKPVDPQVILGDPITGRGSDDTTYAFRKYNQHRHQTALPTNFLLYGVALGQEVYAYDANDQSIFEQILAPTITYLSTNELRISVTAAQSLTAATLYVGAPKEDASNATIIEGVDFTFASNIITFNPDVPRAGFVTATQLSALASYQLSQTNTITASGTYPVIASLPTKSWANSAALYLSAGSGIFQLRQTTEEGTRDLGIPMVVYAASGTAVQDFVINGGITASGLYPVTYSNRALTTDASVIVRADAIYLPSGVSGATLLTAVNLTRVTV